MMVTLGEMPPLALACMPVSTHLSGKGVHQFAYRHVHSDDSHHDDH